MDTEADLSRQLDAARAEGRRLAEEVQRLRGLLGLPSEAPTTHVAEGSPSLLPSEQPHPFLSADSPTTQKIALFRSLFRGREDVYPVLWVNERTGKKGYSPACKGGWSGKQDRAREYLPLTDDVIAEHLMGMHNRPHRNLDYGKAASAVFTEPEIADVGLAEAEAFALGRKLRVTKVPFSANPKSLINGDARGFVKILSDPATGVVLGGSIVGRNAAELISVIAVAVTNGLKTVDIVDSLLVHPALAESLGEAAD